MKVAIMQPYFLPYQGYWQLLHEAEVFVLFDNVKFKKRSWMPRNRVLHIDASKEFNYIKLPAKSASGSLISDVVVSVDGSWFDQIMGTLSVYKRMKAPNYDVVESLFKGWSALGSLPFTDFIATQMLDLIDLLGMECRLIKSSKIDFDIAAVSAPGEWALEISKALCASVYTNPFSGADIFDEERYRNNGIDLRFLKPDLFSYSQGMREAFIPGLSIVDMLMFERIETLSEKLKTNYQVYRKRELERVVD